MLNHLKRKQYYVNFSVLFRIKDVEYSHNYTNVKAQNVFLRNLDLVFGSSPIKYRF